MEKRNKQSTGAVMNYIFIADFFIEDFKGGAEFVNEEVINLLRKNGHSVEKIHCRNTTPAYIKENCDKFFILSNFMSLSVEAKECLYDVDYILYEHDHKYLVNRNPAEYPNMKAPKQLIVDSEIYYNANAVFCQSKIHKEVLEINLPNVNAINLGSSLWGFDFLESIKGIPTAAQNGRAAIIEDSNPIKQQSLAVEWCEENNISYDLIRADSPLGLAKKLSEYEYLVFFPGVLETFCRVAVEAKMVGCKIYSNQLLGAASEEWFTGDRESIIEEMRQAPLKTYLAIQNTSKNRKENKKKDDITVILNAYRRPYNLEGQIAAIRQQSIQPVSIWLWVNAHEDNEGFDFSTLDIDRVFHNDYNWKFYGRFAAALLADTKYVAVFDDDTVPGSKWFQNCLNTMDTHRGILGSAGVILHDSKLYMRHQRCGWPTQNIETTQVDLVGHAWFFERDWLQYLWKEKPFTWDNGEDIQFSYLAQKYGDIQTYCPPHPPDNKDFHGSIFGNELGIDDKATSNNNDTTHQQFFHERDLCVQNAIKNGWETVRNL